MIALVFLGLYAMQGTSGEPKDGLIEEKIVRPGETFIVEDYGDLGESQQPSLVCIYQFRGKERTRVYWYSPNDILGKSYCPEQYDSQE